MPEEKVQVSSVILRIVFILSLSLSWAVGRQFTKSALVIDPTNFFAPYFIVYFMTNLLLTCYPAFLLYNCLCNGRKCAASHREAVKVFPRPSLLRACILLTPFLLLWTAANYTMSQSLGHISTSAALVIRSSDVAVVYVLGFLVLNDTFSLIRSAAVLLAIVGVVVTGLDKEFAGSVLGVGLVIASSVFAAIYKVLFKKVAGSASLGQVSLFMSSMGLLNLVANSAPALWMIQAGVDRMQFATAPWTHIVLSSWLALGKVIYPHIYGLDTRRLF